MRITIIGYGKMGKEIEKIAPDRGHEVILKIDRDNIVDFDRDLFSMSDVAFEFSTPDTAFDNIRAAHAPGTPVVSGTTGWTDRLSEIEDQVKSEKGSFMYSSNFSIGVNILFNLNKRLANIMNVLSSYDVSLEEIHHIRKKDAPSGTAINLAKDIINECSNYNSWILNKPTALAKIGIFSVREGEITGTHKVKWSSEIDSITLEHKANSRKGFALGAIIAAEFIQRKQGVFTMSDLLGF